MSDIVERLLGRADAMEVGQGITFGDTPMALRQAADEITRLRALHCIPEGYAIGDDATVTLAVECVYLKDRAEAAEKLVGELGAAFRQIEAVCSDNEADSCDHQLALKFVHEVTTRARQRRESDGR
jgi:hypothetical protein